MQLNNTVRDTIVALFYGLLIVVLYFVSGGSSGNFIYQGF